MRVRVLRSMGGHRELPFDRVSRGGNAALLPPVRPRARILGPHVWEKLMATIQVDYDREFCGYKVTLILIGWDGELTYPTRYVRAANAIRLTLKNLQHHSRVRHVWVRQAVEQPLSNRRLLIWTYYVDGVQQEGQTRSYWVDMPGEAARPTPVVE